MIARVSAVKTEEAEVKGNESNDVEVQKKLEKGIDMTIVPTPISQKEETQGVKRETAGKPETVLKGKEAVLAVLARAADDNKFLARLADNPAEALEEYYTLTQEEKAALASGDLKKIESWVGKLDQRLATWLWCRLSQEKY